MKGVLDRFEGDQAVILIEKNNEELMIDKDKLPENSEVNTWFEIEKLRGQTQYTLTIDSDKTAQEAQTSAELLAKLRNKSRGSKFKKH